MAARYHFVSTYRFAGDRSAITRALLDVAGWPTWWRWLRRIEQVQAATSDDGVGAAYRNFMTSPLGTRFTYTTTITAVDGERRIDVGSSGDLRGRGRFLLVDEPAGEVELSYTWLVETTKWWMNLLAIVGRPAFGWNHDRLMTDFGHGLAKRAGVRLIDLRNETVRPSDPRFHTMPAVIADTP